MNIKTVLLLLPSQFCHSETDFSSSGKQVIDFFDLGGHLSLLFSFYVTKWKKRRKVNALSIEMRHFPLMFFLIGHFLAWNTFFLFYIWQAFKIVFDLYTEMRFLLHLNIEEYFSCYVTNINSRIRGICYKRNHLWRQNYKIIKHRQRNRTPKVTEVKRWLHNCPSCICPSARLAATTFHHHRR